ncbi:DUF6236 family protein [Peribacillus frigoritolerans]|uniref:DUF6236 family protein n=1 Tax=Peribacillus frigoritolerans TaxID=450367 RepID=UPI003F86A7D0
MGFRILYYPSIEVPNNYWLRRVLLYSDKIATIVPKNLRHKYEANAFIESLLENGEFEPISPEDFLQSDGFEKRNFEEEVRNYIDSGSLYEFVFADRSRKVTEIEMSMDKLDYFSASSLKRQNLIKAKSDMENFAIIDKDIATVYLGILSKYLGREYGYTPSTDHPIYEKMIFNMLGGDNQQGYQVANVQLMNCLPVPTNDISIEDIIKFKKIRNPELQAFKIEYLDFQQKLANSKSREEVNHYLELFNTKMEKELQLVSRLLKESRISFTLDSLKSLLNTKSPALFAGATTLPFFFSSHPNLTAMAITVGISYIGARQALLKKESESPFSYVFHAYNEFGFIPSEQFQS